MTGTERSKAKISQTHLDFSAKDFIENRQGKAQLSYQIIIVVIMVSIISL